MTIKTTSDGAAAVNTEHFWIPVSEVAPPAGVKLLLINRRWGVAHLSIYRKQDDWTHWQALPKFKGRS
jgi:hypothetical protein